MQKQTIMIVEDNKQQADMMNLIISAEQGYTVGGTAESFAEAVEILTSVRITLAIVDITLRGKKNGLDVIRYIQSKFPDILVIVHTVHSENETVFEAFKCGAGGYILKGLGAVEFMHDLKRLCEGDVPFSPLVARKILQTFKEAPDKDYEKLTEREIEILGLADKGYSNLQITEFLHISHHTVYTHFRNIYSKLHVNSKKEALKILKELHQI